MKKVISLFYCLLLLAPAVRADIYNDLGVRVDSTQLTGAKADANLVYSPTFPDPDRTVSNGPGIPQAQPSQPNQFTPDKIGPTQANVVLSFAMNEACKLKDKPLPSKGDSRKRSRVITKTYGDPDDGDAFQVSFSPYDDYVLGILQETDETSVLTEDQSSFLIALEDEKVNLAQEYLCLGSIRVVAQNGDLDLFGSLSRIRDLFLGEFFAGYGKISSFATERGLNFKGAVRAGNSGGAFGGSFGAPAGPTFIGVSGSVSDSDSFVQFPTVASWTFEILALRQNGRTVLREVSNFIKEGAQREIKHKARLKEWEKEATEALAREKIIRDAIGSGLVN